MDYTKEIEDKLLERRVGKYIKGTIVLDIAKDLNTLFNEKMKDMEDFIIWIWDSENGVYWDGFRWYVPGQELMTFDELFTYWQTEINK